MTLGYLAAPILILPLLISGESRVAPETHDGPRYVTVTITSSGYEPAMVSVRSGDVVRFVQQHALAHNIEFHHAPRGAEFASGYEAPPGDIDVLRYAEQTPRVGPMLIGIGRAYEIQIGDEMPPGVYQFGCSRHSHWRGRMIVEGTQARP